MAELSKVDQAQQVFDKMCAVLDAREWKYESFPEDLTIRFHSIGDDLPMEFIGTWEDYHEFEPVIDKAYEKFCKMNEK